MYVILTCIFRSLHQSHFVFLFYLIHRGVSAVSFAAHGSCIYSAGADGMICEIDSLTGNLLEKFRASTKGISCMAVSPGMYPSWFLLCYFFMSTLFFHALGLFLWLN